MGMGGNMTDGRGFGRIKSWWDQMRSQLANWNIFGRESMKKIWIILQNNIAMLLYHFLILVITIVLYRTFIYNYPDALYIENTIYNQIWLGFWIIFPLFLYFFAGYTLKLTRNVYTDFASFILFGSIGILLWIYCIQHPNWDNSQWILFQIYTVSTSEISYTFFNRGNNIDLFLLDIVIPTFVCFFGMELKRVVAHRKSRIITVMKQENL
jgi:hypothetical protein